MIAATIVTARAADIETLLMPGKVVQAHAELEGKCANCHDRADRSRQATLCADCHKDIRADLIAQRGFHGKLLGGERMQCRACHSEHQGRNADIVKLVSEQFDHERTDFPLRDAHATAACDSCHVAGKRYRETPTDCHACHRNDEPHGGSLGKRCENCHETATWSRIRFDHGKTAFTLTGKHSQLACVACHFDNRFAGIPRQCASCHAPDDTHRGTRGDACEKCHTTAQWATQRFDHLQETGFALVGAHTRIDCAGCHTSGRMQDPVPKDCFGCHKARDAHAGRFGERCGDCHTSERWQSTTFDHAKTEFALAGAHAKVDCHACHTASLTTQKLSGACSTCHLGDDVHAGSLGNDCTSCHVTEGWRKDVSFDHDLSDFPLIGQHVAVTCGQFHVTPAYGDVAHECVACHQRKDKHAGTLGNRCDDCHSPNGWNLWQFDHARVTRFALTGGHEKAACGDCHRRPPNEVPLSQDCASCHTKDDVHFGEFGRQCQRCHSTISFRQVRIR